MGGIVQKAREQLRSLQQQHEDLVREVTVLRARQSGPRFLVVAHFPNHDIPVGLVENEAQARVLAEDTLKSPPTRSPFTELPIVEALDHVQVLQFNQWGIPLEAIVFQTEGHHANATAARPDRAVP